MEMRPDGQHCAAVQAHAESYIGLVEVGVGLIPGWGGCTTMLRRWAETPRAPRGPMPPVAKAFEMISTAQVAKSAFELARKRSNKVCSMEKANVMESGILWRDVVQEVRDNIEEKYFNDAGDHEDDEEEGDHFRSGDLFPLTNDVGRESAFGSDVNHQEQDEAENVWSSVDKVEDRKR